MSATSEPFATFKENPIRASMWASTDVSDWESTMTFYQSRSAVILVAAMMAAAASILGGQEKPAAKDADAKPEAYSAVAIGTGGSVGGKTKQFDFRISQYTTDAELNQYAETLKEKGPDALRKALEKLDVGRVNPVGSTGNQIAVARKRQVGTDTVITIVTARVMSLGELYNNGRSTDYPFGFLQVTINQKGEGTGQIMAAAKIRFNKKKGHYEIESYGNQYVKVVNVRP